MKITHKDCKYCKYFHQCLYHSIGTFCGFEYFAQTAGHKKATLANGSSDEAQISIEEMI